MANLQLDDIRQIAQKADPLGTLPETQGSGPKAMVSENAPRVGFIRDRSFWLYYPENLEQLEHFGAVLVEIDAI